MQQTEKYQFNLIEPSDTFSPNPLNENMEKVEAQFDAVRAEAAAGDAALDARLQVFEAKHFEVGTYMGTGETPDYVILGYTPKLVTVFTGSEHHTVILDVAVGSNGIFYLKLAEGGFQVGKRLNEKHLYHYLAIG